MNVKTKRIFLICISLMMLCFSCSFEDSATVSIKKIKPFVNNDISLIALPDLKKPALQQNNLDIENAGQGGFESTNQNTAIHLPTEENEKIKDDENKASLSYIVYRVKKGDMVGVLAENFGVTQDTIISVNNIKQTRTIQPGQYFRIPSIPGILYTVRQNGETIESIAKYYEVSAEKCGLVNDIDLTSPLNAGKTLFVPDAELDWVTRQEINGDLFLRPLRGWYYFSSYFGWRNSPFTGVRSYHNGIDMAATTGTNIYAALDGTVTTAGWSDTYGNYVIVRHHSGYKTLYGHMSKINVTVGQYVRTSTVLGKVGSTGMSTGPHLHFTIYKNGVAVNPQNLWK